MKRHFFFLALWAGGDLLPKLICVRWCVPCPLECLRIAQLHRASIPSLFQLLLNYSHFWMWDASGVLVTPASYYIQQWLEMAVRGLF
jgi:hypothetical protein